MDARLREGIRLFNARKYFESHEAFEEFFHQTEEPNRPFTEGLVQLAAACRLFTDFGEAQGPARMMRQAIIRLENYEPHFLGIKVSELIRSLEACADEMETAFKKGASIDLNMPQIKTLSFLFR